VQPPLLLRGEGGGVQSSSVEMLKMDLLLPVFFLPIEKVMGSSWEKVPAPVLSGADEYMVWSQQMCGVHWSIVH